jgi:hypothetical protein
VNASLRASTTTAASAKPIGIDKMISKSIAYTFAARDSIPAFLLKCNQI